jgi:hypothetical protein
MNWTHLAQSRDQLGALVNIVMNLQVARSDNVAPQTTITVTQNTDSSIQGLSMNSHSTVPRHKLGNVCMT